MWQLCFHQAEPFFTFSNQESCMQLDLDIHNFYEHLVLEHLEANNLTQVYDKEFLADLCCLTLSQLPARYIRHDIDMAFYLGQSERMKMSDQVDIAIEHSLNFLQEKSNASDTDLYIKQS
jgi:hypothetical protein